MILRKEMTVDLYNPYPLPIMNAKQGDTARGFLVRLKAGSDPFIGSGTVDIYILKPDGTKIYNACSIDDNVVTGTLTNQALAVAGEAQAEIQITSGEDILSTPIFIINILPTNIDDEAIESDNDFSALETAIGQLSSYNSIAEMPLGDRLGNTTDLAAAHAAQGNNRFAFFRYLNTTTDKPPGANNGGVISYKYASSSDYGAQLGLSMAGLLLRTENSGTWSDWVKCNPVYTTLTSGASSITLVSSHVWQVGNAVTVQVRFTPTAAISGAVTGVFSTVPRAVSKVVVDIYEDSTGSGVASVGKAYLVRAQTDIRFSGVTLASGTTYTFAISYCTY